MVLLWYTLCLQKLPIPSQTMLHDQVFVPFLLQQLEDACRVDVVWNWYLANSIKGLIREHRGSGVRTKVSSQTKISKKWEDFLRDSRNKTELFSFLTVRVGY